MKKQLDQMELRGLQGLTMERAIVYGKVGPSSSFPRSAQRVLTRGFYLLSFNSIDKLSRYSSTPCTTSPLPRLTVSNPGTPSWPRTSSLLLRGCPSLFPLHRERSQARRKAKWSGRKTWGNSWSRYVSWAERDLTSKGFGVQLVMRGRNKSRLFWKLRAAILIPSR